MNKALFLLSSFSLSLFLFNCHSGSLDKTSSPLLEPKKKKHETLNLLTDLSPISENGEVNAVIEIPSGTTDKWELDKSSGELQWEIINEKPRIINYIGYPGNYGMIPRTLLPKENGGDGDPLDILVLGAPVERGRVLKCKIIGLLYLSDRGEQDDKLIAVSSRSPMYGVNSIDELNQGYKGVTEIVELWFTNYKGPGKMESKGFGNKKEATAMLNEAIHEYTLRHEE